MQITEQELNQIITDCINEELDEWGGWGAFKTAKNTFKRQDRYQRRYNDAVKKGKMNKAIRNAGKLEREKSRVDAARQMMGVKEFPYNEGDKPDFATDKDMVMKFQSWVNANSQQGPVLAVDGLWGPKSQAAFNEWIKVMKQQLGQTAQQTQFDDNVAKISKGTPTLKYPQQ